MVALVEGTRIRIVNLLQRQGQATVEQLARSLGLAPATVRRHLDILQRDRLIAFREVRKKTGRPEYSYFLTDAGQESLPKEYQRFLSLLLEELGELSEEEVAGKDGKQIREYLFARMALRLVAPYEARLNDGHEARLSALLQLLAQEHYLPEVERLEGSVRIRLFNCPFRSVALAQQSVCEFDRYLISSKLGVPVKQERCIHTGPHGCSYIVALPA